MTRFFGRSVALSFLATGIGLSLLIAVGLIVIQLFGGQPFIERIACVLELSDDCLQEELEQERNRLHLLRDRNRELEALYERLDRLDFASESFVVFYRDNSGPHEVVTGHRYASLIEPGTLTGGWCYVDLPTLAGLSNQVFVARMDADMVVTPEPLEDSALREVSMTRSDVAEAAGRCQWPGGAP